MKLFGQLVRTVVNVATLPVAVAQDVFSLGGVALDRDEPFTVSKLKQLKDEASPDFDPDDRD